MLMIHLCLHFAQAFAVYGDENKVCMQMTVALLLIWFDSEQKMNESNWRKKCVWTVINVRSPILGEHTHKTITMLIFFNN